jgi:hypothetical protein
MMDQVRFWLGLVANALIILGMPVLIAWAATNIREKTAQVKANLGEERWSQLDALIQSAVRFAEQTGVIENLVGPEKKRLAIEYVQQRLEEQGIRGVNVAHIADLIENEVRHQFQNPTGVQDTIEAREQLINQVIDDSIRAAEQSGLLGTIENKGQAKKEYAVSHVQSMLADYGITLPEAMITGLIEARLLRMLLRTRIHTDTNESV